MQGPAAAFFAVVALVCGACAFDTNKTTGRISAKIDTGGDVAFAQPVERSQSVVQPVVSLVRSVKRSAGKSDRPFRDALEPTPDKTLESDSLVRSAKRTAGESHRPARHALDQTPDKTLGSDSLVRSVKRTPGKFLESDSVLRSVKRTARESHRPARHALDQTPDETLGSDSLVRSVKRTRKSKLIEDSATTAHASQSGTQTKSQSTMVLGAIVISVVMTCVFAVFKSRSQSDEEAPPQQQRGPPAKAGMPMLQQQKMPVGIPPQPGAPGGTSPQALNMALFDSQPVAPMGMPPQLAKADMSPEAASPPKAAMSEDQAAIKIQAAFRGNKARDHTVGPGGEPLPQGTRTPEPGQQIALVVNVLKGNDMPSVNTFGGCDPFVEVRVVDGDPTKSLRPKGGVETVPKKSSAQTEAIQNTMAPEWNETIIVKDVGVNEDTYMQHILWDHNLTGATPIGYGATPVQEVLTGAYYDSSGTSPFEKDMELTFPNCVMAASGMKLNAQVFTKISYWEHLDFNISKIKGRRLPSVDLFGTIDAFVEFRVVRTDPSKTFLQDPGPECLLCAKTKAVENCIDPKFSDDVRMNCPVDPQGWLQFVIWDQQPTPLPNRTVGQCYLKMSDILGQQGPGKPPVEHSMKMKPLPGVEPPADLHKAKFTVCVGYSLAFKK